MKTKYNKLEDFELLQYYAIAEKDQFNYVYPPGDDSFLMLAVLNQEIKKKQIKQSQIIAEIGCGSGILLAHLYYWLQKQSRSPTIAFSTDINYDACIMAQKYYRKYNLNIQIINTSILNNIQIKPSIIICNPPYIPTQKQQEQKQKERLKLKLKELKQKKYHRTYDNNLIAYSWMGGSDGLQVVWKLLQKVNWKCMMYFVLIGQNPIELFKQKVTNDGYCFELLAVKQKFNEILHIVKIWKN